MAGAHQEFCRDSFGSSNAVYVYGNEFLRIYPNYIASSTRNRSVASATLVMILDNTQGTIRSSKFHFSHTSLSMFIS